MFDNIGKKIKALTVVLCSFISVICFLAGVIILISVRNSAAIGIPLMLGGPLLCWLNSFLLYGFGELVDKTASIEEMMRKGSYKTGPSGSAANGNPRPASASVRPMNPRPAPFLAPALIPSSDGNFKYLVMSDGSVCITQYIGNASAVEIPEKLDGKTVTALGDTSFSSCSKVTGITVPQSIKTIGKRAFHYCGSLRQIVLQEGITAISYAAFYACRSLTNIRIPESVTLIDAYAFAYCNSLKNINIPRGVITIGESAFAECPNLILTVTPGSCGEQYCKDNGLKYRYAD